MRNVFQKLVMISALLASLSVGARAARWTTVYDFRFLGGQHFFEGASSAVSGNIDATVSPTIKFSERWSVVPSYQGQYRGTRDVQELAGGGTLFQDSMAHGVLLKSVHTLSPRWKLKPSVGARYAFLREVKGEGWNDGLFNYQKYSAGLEMERTSSSGRGGRLAYDFYTLTFPNYESLESSQDATLSRELAGTDVLNNKNHMVTAGWWAGKKGGAFREFSVYYNRREYDDQPVVSLTGDLTGTSRADSSIAGQLSFSKKWSLWNDSPMVGELGLGVQWNDSNQNHYDARKTFFTQDYYDYNQFSLSPRVSFAWAESSWVWSWGGGYQRRTYSDRLAQNSNGDNLSSKTELTLYSTDLGVTIPMGSSMRLLFQGQLAWSDSNSTYEQVYRYNYRIANYLVGFSYAY